MRAGHYAEFSGRTYPCAGLRRPRIRPYESLDRPRPEGFEPNDDGMWTRLVDRSEVTRLLDVATVAVWQGRRVTVRQVLDGTGDAVVEQWGAPIPEHPAVQVVENGLWQARVPLDSLTEVVEEVTEVPV